MIESSETIPVDNTEQPTSRAMDIDTVLVERTLRSGQNYYYDGNIVILGDVNPGAEIVATGDIIVMGVLRGVVHAGVEGNEGAKVIAFRLQPTQLRIANHITRASDGEAEGSHLPEIACIKDGNVVIETFST